MQQWVKYIEWEDWINGMWRKISPDQEDQLLKLAVNFTGNYIAYRSAMQEVVLKWPKTMINSLSNPSVNKRAFIGHCAVSYRHGIPEYITRKAWFMLTEKQRNLADNEAQKVYNKWKIKYLHTLSSGKSDVTTKAFRMKAQVI
ncbi:MAG: hypothetical protein V4560_15005 [Bacteroidota bacterium]